MANFLSEDKKQEILALLRLKYSQREIQRRSGVRRETISKYGQAAGILSSALTGNIAEVGAKAAKVPSGSGTISHSHYQQPAAGPSY